MHLKNHPMLLSYFVNKRSPEAFFGFVFVVRRVIFKRYISQIQVCTPDLALKKDKDLMRSHNNQKNEEQVTQCIALLQKVFNKDLLGVYLYGSSLVGGLGAYSDLDLLS